MARKITTSRCDGTNGSPETLHHIAPQPVPVCILKQAAEHARLALLWWRPSSTNDIFRTVLIANFVFAIAVGSTGLPCFWMPRRYFY